MNLQQAQERIEALEARLDALENEWKAKPAPEPEKPANGKAKDGK